MGVGAYSMPFDEVMSMMEENVSCYNCHANNPGDGGKLTVTHSYVVKQAFTRSRSLSARFALNAARVRKR